MSNALIFHSDLLSISDINDLGLVLLKLRYFPKARWKDFGLKSGLHPNTLEEIQANNAGKPQSVDDCFTECVVCWLKRKDDVDEVGEPTLQRLADIVEETAEGIRMRNGAQGE